MKTTIALILIGIIFLTLSVTSALATTEHCPAGYEKKDEHFPFSYTTTVGKRINKICIKSSTSVFEFLTNGSNGCYLRSGIGSQTASAFKVGFGSSCKDISHVAFYTEVIPTPTPPTPEPTIEPSPEPTSTPEPSPTPEIVIDNPPCGIECQQVIPPQSQPVSHLCTETDVVKHPANVHVFRRGDQAVVRWYPTEGRNANIYYRQNSSLDWQYSVIGIENNGSFLISGLGNMDITFAVQQVNSCSGGPLSPAVIDGPSASWVLFR